MSPFRPSVLRGVPSQPVGREVTDQVPIQKTSTDGKMPKEKKACKADGKHDSNVLWCGKDKKGLADGDGQNDVGERPSSLQVWRGRVTQNPSGSGLTTPEPRADKVAHPAELNLAETGKAGTKKKTKMTSCGWDALGSLDFLDCQGRRVLQEHPCQVLPSKSYRTQILAAMTVAIGNLVVGTSTAYTSPALASMNSTDSLIQPTQEEATWIGSLMPLCALCGAIVGGTLIEKLGRKHTLLLSSIPFTASWLLIAFAQDIMMIYAGRAFAGLCVGVISLASPIYMSEISEPAIRGTLGVLSSTVGNFGILFIYLMGYFLEWDQLALVSTAIPVIFISLLFLIPETPRWYLSKGKKKQAKKALIWLRSKGHDVDSELIGINTHIEAQMRQKTTLKDLVTKPLYVRALFISLGLMFFQQFSGINAVIFYTVDIFRAAGSTVDGYLSTIIVGLVNLASTIFANVFVDRLGRKVLMYVSGTVMTVSLAALGAFFYLKNTYGSEGVSSLGWLPLTSLVLYVIAFSFGVGPVPWLMMGEIFPSKIKGVAGSLTTSFNWICTFIVTKNFDGMTEGLGTHGAFWLFMANCIVAVLFVAIFVPETKGQTLEQIQEDLNETNVFRAPSRSLSRIVRNLSMVIRHDEAGIRPTPHLDSIIPEEDEEKGKLNNGAGPA
ncbi:unnamed protein product [Darwinula stevensoni]|uniref:Major facilitator superfamily (MFS) profile domain-containing protein n=1 Tax=Darwinula stevensoni TaxID=69355 RepID=A0A7R8XC38_9CRUS|nr:unnamed protein product [Darwinula stevensoni]CAG0891792.1 unnamed protein product [Darwinula stevensoni]